MSERTCAIEAESIMIEVRTSFHRINNDENLTEANKKQLKDFYLQHMIAPTARKLLEKYFPNEFKTDSYRTALSASPDRNILEL